MWSKVFSGFGGVRLVLVCGWMSLPLLAGRAYGQGEHLRPHTLPVQVEHEAIAAAKEGLRARSCDPNAATLLADAGDQGALPLLERVFDHCRGALVKGKIAGALIRLGDTDPQYWDFLLKHATNAVADSAPTVLTYDADGRGQPVPSPAFLAWAAAQASSLDDAEEDTLYLQPAKVAMLGATGDPRGVPVLRLGLYSSNAQLVIEAAKGLAQAQDADSIPLLIAVCETAPADVATAVAESLVYFDDARAQAAVDTYVPSNFAVVLRAAVALGKTPYR